MKIEFKNNKMIITHPSGHVDELEKADLERFKNFLLQRKKEIEKQVSEVESDLVKI